MYRWRRLLFASSVALYRSLSNFIDTDVSLDCVACINTIVNPAMTLVYKRVTTGCRCPVSYVYVRTLNSGKSVLWLQWMTSTSPAAR
uniref:Secreted protein n=1 Tax=Anguilla anguilla TaxID=7936 RepID=A0A0E9QPS8_ANGAN